MKQAKLSFGYYSYHVTGLSGNYIFAVNYSTTYVYVSTTPAALGNF